MGWTTYLNPAGSSGGTPIGNWMNWPTASQPKAKPSYQVYGDGTPVNPAPKSKFQQLYDSYQKEYSDAKKANEDRYNQGLGLLGMGGSVSGSQPDVLGGNAYSVFNPGSGQNSGAPPLPQGYGTTSDLFKKNTEAGAKVDQESVSRGIYNTSGALNQRGLSNSLALREQDRADQGLALQAQNQQFNQGYQTNAFNYGAGQDALARQDSLRGQRLGWLEGRQDPYPNENLLATLAGQLGQGSTDGLDAGAFIGGGGGGWMDPSSMGYQIPGQSWGRGGFDWSGGGYTTQTRSGPSMRDTAFAMRMKQDEMDAKRAWGAKQSAPGTPIGNALFDYNVKQRQASVL